MSALLVVVVIGVASMIMAKGAAFLSIGELDMGKTISEAGNVHYLTESCLDEVLLRIKRDNSFFANVLELTINDYSCIINVSGTNFNKNISINGGMGKYQKNLIADVSIVDENVILENIE